MTLIPLSIMDEPSENGHPTHEVCGKSRQKMKSSSRPLHTPMTDKTNRRGPKAPPLGTPYSSYLTWGGDYPRLTLLEFTPSPTFLHPLSLPFDGSKGGGGGR